MGFLRKIEKAFRPVLKRAPAIIGTVGGGFLGGPAGAALGGGLGNMLRPEGNKLKRFAEGVGWSIPYSAAAPQVGKVFFGGGLMPPDLSRRLFMMDSPSLFNQLGITNNPGIGEGVGLTSLIDSHNAQNQMQQYQNQNQEAFQQYQQQQHQNNAQMGNILDNLTPFARNALPLALTGAGIAGTLLGRTRPSREPSMEEILAAHRPHWGAEDQPRRIKPIKRKKRRAPDNDSDTEWKYFEEINPKIEYYREGGPIRGSSGGQDDNVRKDLPVRDYILNATDISLLGDGNTENGFKKVAKWEKEILRKAHNSFSKSNIVNVSDNIPKFYVPARVSPGEFELNRKTIYALGNGDYQKGLKKIEHMRLNLRKHKGVKKILPPKAKNISSYMG